MALPHENNQNTDSAYVIKTATREELAIVLGWAAAEGWNPGLHDAECFYAADQNGFLIGLLNGEPIASISAVRYGNSFGFIGCYIVKPEFRGHGYGLQIWERAIAYLQGRTIGLDGVLQQQNNYAKSGFELAHRNIRYEGKGDALAVEPGLKSNLLTEVFEPEARFVPVSSLPLEAIIEYDRAIFSAERSDFLQKWLSMTNHTAIGCVIQQKLIGYGVIRPCQQGYKIGPLFADTAEVAEAIFLALKVHVEPGSPFYLDVPEVNAAAIAIAEKYQMSVVFETARMYRPAVLNLPLSRIFGITTFELG